MSVEQNSRWCIHGYDETYFGVRTGPVNDKISEKAKAKRYTMKHFDRMRDWELFKFCQGLDEDESLGISLGGAEEGEE